MHASFRCCLMLVPLLAAACASTQNGYRQGPSLAEPTPAPQDQRTTYLDLIGRMQAQGAWYASLAHVDAYRQRFGDSPALRLLQADALRQTGQVDAAQALYQALGSGAQAGAAAHGLGLIAAARNDDAGSEQALARASQLEPLNTDYLGDLGFARLRDGQFEQAREPLAKALELAPGNARAAANLALWATLRGDTATAERLMQQGNLGEESRQGVAQQAQQIRQRLQQRAQAAAAAASAAAQATPAAQTATATTPRRLAAESRTDARSTGHAETRLPPSMLERFRATDTAPENRP
ncbi:Flp pilus assembly protein TadD [Stenotrophomonas sp. 24(2023)]|uniref:Flp pilus assembly protein TadD n=1 Tax=Stenotrophomonas sp. 24(2023) TaxID=3068324 RepID=UPI0027DEEEBA|nr:Flp pilus assembly protein TadD [Stenotrophomonas sp. 24(2023)]WMJ69497.1 Flp pilus assembly protein TadD [Stenotrophomonas sp. 24(2023)]